LSISFFVLFAVATLKGETIITGSCDGGEGYVIRIIIPEDLVSGIEKTVAIDTIRKDGSFFLSCKVEDPTYAILDVEFHEGDIYLMPDTRYEIEILFDPENQRAIYYDRTFLEFNVIKEGPDNLNSLIREVNSVFNAFVLGRFNDVYRNRKTYLIDSLRLQLEGITGENDMEYLNAYVDYKMAGLEQAARMKSRQKVAMEYLIRRPVLYDNVEYYYFFMQFFEKYLLANNGVINYHDVHEIFLEGGTVHDLLGLIRSDPLLRDDRLSEFFLLTNFKTLYYDPEFNSMDVTTMVKELADTSAFAGHRDIASNLLKRFNKLRAGTPPPRLALPDVEGNIISLDSLKGKVVYLYFYITGNRTCEFEMEKMVELRGKLPESIEFVGISADKKWSVFSSLAMSDRYPWKLLHYNDDIELLEAYDAVTYPLYVIIGKDGNIASYPAPRPSENPDGLLLSILQKKNRSNR
jgi:peroxiredoxin